MIAERADRYIKACMQAWLYCESCIHAEVSGHAPRYHLVEECQACAKACFAVVCHMVSNQDGMQQVALHCVIHCRQCQMECEKYGDEESLRTCGEVCRYCADKIRDIVFPPPLLN